MNEPQTIQANQVNLKPLDVQLRWCIRSDLPEMLRVERFAFESPWTEEDFLHCLKQRSCIGWVAIYCGHIVGHMLYDLKKRHLHLLNFAVLPAMQGRGIGRQMIEKLIGKIDSYNRTCIKTEVWESNLGAQLFFKRMGFKATSIFHGYDFESGEDAYRFEFHKRSECE